MNLDKIIAVRTSKTIFRDKDVVIKVFDEEYSKAAVLNEALNQARVEETNLNTPKVLEVAKIDNKWAIVSNFIKGKTLSKLMEENPDKEDEYLDLFVNLHLQVFANKCPLLNKLKDKLNLEISNADIDATIRYELHTRLEGMPKHTKLCHGDFVPSNIIIGEDNVPYILDWSHATQGNSSADVARTYLLLILQGRESFAEKYLNLFSARSGIDIKYIQKWLPIVAASQSEKGKSAEHDLLLKWVNVVDYE